MKGLTEESGVEPPVRVICCNCGALSTDGNAKKTRRQGLERETNEAIEDIVVGFNNLEANQKLRQCSSCRYITPHVYTDAKGLLTMKRRLDRRGDNLAKELGVYSSKNRRLFRFSVDIAKAAGSRHARKRR